MIIKSKRKYKIPNYKSLTENKEIVNLLDDKEVCAEVYFPCVTYKNAPLKEMVKIGDKVLVGDMILLREDMYVPIFSSVSGVVKEYKDIFYPTLGRNVKHLVIENDFKYEETKETKKLDLNKARKKEVVKAIKESGIIGMGGSGFPTYAKYENVSNINTLLINAVECEPFLTTDYVVTLESIDLILKGIILLLKASEAKEAFIVIKKGKKVLHETINKALENYENIKLVEVPDKYPMGWERNMVTDIIKKEYSRLPSEVGVIVNNIQTSLYVARALSLGEKPSKRVVTFSGTGMKNPTNVIVPIGVLVNKVVEKLGGYTKENVSVLPGGPMTSKAVLNDEFAILLNTGAVCAFEKIEYELLPCLRCGKCIEYCPIYLRPIEIKEAFEDKDVEKLKELEVDRCCECGLCSFVCPSKIELADFVKKAKLYVKVLSSTKKN